MASQMSSQAQGGVRAYLGPERTDATSSGGRAGTSGSWNPSALSTNVSRLDAGLDAVGKG
jgi:hypothetical protein